jgi:hypothetical protein
VESEDKALMWAMLKVGMMWHQVQQLEEVTASEFGGEASLYQAGTTGNPKGHGLYFGNCATETMVWEAQEMHNPNDEVVSRDDNQRPCSIVASIGLRRARHA